MYSSKDSRSSHTPALVSALTTALLIAACEGSDVSPQTEFRPNDTGAAVDATVTSPGALAAAVRGGRVEVVRELLQQGADVNAAAVDGTTPLLEAVGTRNGELVELLLAAGADADATNRYGMSALHLAARGADARSSRALLGAGADPSRALPEGETVLMAAAKSGNPEVVAALLPGGETVAGNDYAPAVVVSSAPDPNARENWYGQTALMWAAAAGNTEAMQLLIDAGADVNQASSRIAAPEVEPDRQQGGFVYAEIPEGRLTALHFAAREGEQDAAQVLIDAGADLDLGDGYGTTPLVLATLNGHLGIAANLLEAGADPNKQDRYGRSVLFVATDLNTMDVNPRPAPPITGDYTPVDIVRLALAHGAEVDLAITDEGLPAWVAQGGTHNPILYKGATALLRAAMSGDLEIMRMLLDAGADPLVVTDEQPCRLPGDQCERSTYMPPDSRTSVIQAAAGVGWRLGISRGREADAIEAVKLLLERDADINAPNHLGNAPLHGAATRHAPALIEFLVENGADLSAKNERGWTPLDIAMGQPDFRIPADQETAEVLRRLMIEPGIPVED